MYSLSMKHFAVNVIICLIFIPDFSIQEDASLSEFANTFKICSLSDPLLDQCVVESLNGAREKLAKGLPTIGLPPLSALPVKSMLINEGPEEAHLDAALMNSTWFGLDSYNVTKAKVDIPGLYIEFVTVIPTTLIKGYYRFNGLLITLRIEGEGTFDIEFRNITVTHRIKLQEKEEDGKKFWNVSDYIFDMKMEYSKSNFRNLFRGNRRLGIYANNFINNNWKIIYAFYGQPAKKALGTPFMDYTNQLLNKIPMEKLFRP